MLANQMLTNQTIHIDYHTIRRKHCFPTEQINRKDKVIDSLLNQLPKKNNSTQHNKTPNTKTNTISIQTELIADSESTESSLIKLKRATQKEYR